MRGGVAVLVATLAVFAAGCQDQEKIALQNDKKALAAQVERLQGENAAMASDKDSLAAQNAGLMARNDDLTRQLSEAKKGRGGSVGNGAAAAGDWEKGLSGDRVTLGTDILFPAGKAELTAAGKAALDKIARDLKAQYAGLPVRVYGHTDTDPIVKTKNLWTDNLDLSANRAMAVTRYLIGHGIDAKQVETIAMGEHHPAGSKNASRRVEIIVIKAPGAGKP
jgi:outer membrane protein OmpA-like peptidoglycan-associated protein